MSRVLLIDPFSGASGDMLLAALIDAGAPLDEVRERLLGIAELSGAKIDIEPVMRGHFAARRLVLDLPHDHAHRGLEDITRIIAAAPGLSETVRERARATFTRLAMAEARMHGKSVETVHFHEVGALDSILDIIGFHVAAEAIGIESFRYTRLVLGGGSISSAHGEIPVPAPATLELLRGHPISFSGRDEELVTPTAAAIIATVFSAIEPGESVTADNHGYGAGTRESDGLPNILRVLVGEKVSRPRTLTVIRCTIDDMTPEVYGHVMESLFKAGAREVYFHPVIMKKNRPGIEATVLCEDADATRIAEHIMAETTTLGVRVAREERVELERRADTVDTPLGTAKVKLAVLPGGDERMSPEYESCRELAASSGKPILEVYDIVRVAWRASRNQ